MKKISVKKILFVFVFLILIVSCSGTKPKETIDIKKDNELSTENFVDKMQDLTSRLSANYELTSESENKLMSPLSIYMVLAMLSEITNGNSYNDLCKVLNMKNYELRKIVDYYEEYTKTYYSDEVNLNDYQYEMVAQGGRFLSNSLWLNKDIDLNVKNDCLSSLMKYYKTDVFSLNITSKNDEANSLLFDYAFGKMNNKEATINSFNLSTCAMLMNTLYLSDVWKNESLKISNELYDFKNAQNQKVPMLLGHYEAGQVYETSEFRHFYIKTRNNYTLKFIVPKDGYSVKDVFTKDNILKINKLTKYNDVVNQTSYLTRCIFPKFKIESNFNVMEVLKVMGLKSSLTDFSKLSSVLKGVEISQCATLDVNENGIVGTAVTQGDLAGSSAMQKVYTDFIVDRPFGFILLDENDFQLFSGVVNLV